MEVHGMNTSTIHTCTLLHDYSVRAMCANVAVRFNIPGDLPAPDTPPVNGRHTNVVPSGIIRVGKGVM